MNDKNKTCHFIAHTHWDREWYRTFEQFRMILVELVDDIIDILETQPDFKNFHLDGQTVVLADYLEIRPEKFQTLKNLVQQKKLFIGPWYVLPDEFLVSGEALVRNLLLGHKIVQKFGGVMKIGYIPDSFGHISQLPQIFNGFDIDNIILWRGIGGEVGQQHSEYIWQSPDGSQALMLHLPKDGYGSDYICSPEKSEVKKKGQKIIETLAPRAQTPHLLCMQGADHLWAHRKFAKIIDQFEKQFQTKAVHSSLEQYLSEIRKYKSTFKTITGELRWSYRYAYLLQGVYSSRIYLKQYNTYCQNLLTKYAEPLNIIAGLSGKKTAKPFLDLAWNYLLQNHAHDSICGCSIDAVHREMMTRFEKCEQIAQRLIHNSINFFDNKTQNEKSYLSIFNPSPYSRSELIEGNISFSHKDENEKYFKIIDKNQNEIVYQIIDQQNQQTIQYFKYDYLKINSEHNYKILFDANSLPSLGLNSYKIVPLNQQIEYSSKLKVGRFFMENEFTRVEVSENGIVKIMDKLNGYTYNKLNMFEDSGDVGDEYNYSYPEQDEVILSTKFKPRISLIESGPLRGAIRIRIRMQIPASAANDGKSRSKEKVVLKISSIVYLDYNSPTVYFKTTINNPAKDHRMRIFMKTGIKSIKSYAETAFHIIEREHKYYDPKNFTMELPSATHPMQRFVSVIDNEKGVTLFSNGLPEYELSSDNTGTLALTLLRCVGKLSSDQLLTRPGGHAGPPLETPEAQCLGEYCFEYALYCHSSSMDEETVQIHQYADRLYTKPVCAQTCSEFEQKSFIALKSEILQLSAFKECEHGEGYMLRVYNPTNQNLNGRIKINFPFESIYTTNMNEETIRKKNLNGSNELKLKFTQWQVQTIKICAK